MIKNITPSKEFKAQTSNAIIAIVFFAITYLILAVAALGLTALCVLGGLTLIMAFPRLITIILGVGLAAMGGLILIFLLKFIFSSNKADRSHLIEIKKADEPKIFEVIEEIVKEVGTRFPKKVYLSPEVNASVFYDSNFWSMFLPIKKNLVIGVGLVNTITQEELKAVLAHEFGHFSQKTMKVGSYVYNVNQVIFNMLYDNEGYDKLVQGWANVSGYIALFAVVAVRIVQGIQWILKKMYNVVNKSYLALSREMEFHADEIAAHVTGYPPLKNALLRMQLASHSYNNVLSFYDEKVKENKYSANLYPEQSFVMQVLAKDSDLAIKDSFPEVTLDELNKFNKSKLMIKDQWASHPSLEDRIARLEQTKIVREDGNTAPGNTIFADFQKTQKTLTQHLFKGVKFSPGEDRVSVSLDRFQLEYKESIEKNAFPTLFNGYYDSRNIPKFSLAEVATSTAPLSLEALYTDGKINLVHTEIALKNDIDTLQLIAENVYEVKTFDYDGIKYKRKAAKMLVEKLNQELVAIDTALLENDKQAYSYFKQLEMQKGGSQLDVLYATFFDFDSVFDTKYELYTDMHQKLQFINYTTPFEEIQANFRHLTSLERRLKSEISLILEDPKYSEELTLPIKESFTLYLSQDWQYFGKQTYFDNNLEILFEALNNYGYMISRGYFIRKNALLDYKASLV